MKVRKQTFFGALLTGAIISAWVCLHLYSVFFHRLSGAGLAVAPLLALILCWLNVGLFIIAHDAMHGSLFPTSPRANRIVGRIAVALYAAFGFDKLKRNHLQHHRSPGSTDDPDFNAAHPRQFWPWYLVFMRRYFGYREFLVLCGPVATYLLIGAHVINLLLFWATPAALSSIQLFTFGTFLPHRHNERPFDDSHNARTNEFGWLTSLITCFHFGYHHEHHLAPHVPWWGLPAERKRRLIARSSPQLAKARPLS